MWAHDHLSDMNLWDPSFCDLFFEPVPEEVLSLVDEMPLLQLFTACEL